MKLPLLLLLTSVCFTAFACTYVAPAHSTAQAPRPDTPAIPSEYVPTVIPITPTYEGCAYVWGSQDLPELSRALNAALQETGTDVTGLAYAYGENCVYGDGHQTFGAMETDFRIGVKVKSIRDEAALGDWIYRVMQKIEALPADELQGPQPGRVDFDFKQPDPAELFVTVPIDKYRREADDLRGAQLLRLFYTP